MSSPSPSVEPAAAGPRTPIVNDFTIQVATVNGSGSQTANMVILRAIFMKGVGLETLWREALALTAWGIGILLLAIARSTKRAA